MTDRQKEHGEVLPEWLRLLEEVIGLLGGSLAETIAGRMAELLPDVEAQGKKTLYELAAIKDRNTSLTCNW